MPRDLVGVLKQEADEAGSGLTAHVLRYLEGIRTWFGLPKVATDFLEADRKALRLTRYEYLLHVIFQRALELREKGPGFDAAVVERLRRR